jgi:3-oxoadipate enol-lactonase
MTGMAILAHRVDGTGERVLLLNGGMMTIASWEPVAARLAERYRVIRCDLRGQLLTPGPPPPTFAGHVADVAALLDHLCIDRAHVIGTSFGGEVAVLFAATHPERTSSLVATTAADRYDEAGTPAMQQLRLATQRAVNAGEKRAFFEHMFPITYSAAFLATHGATLRAQVEERIAKLPDAWYRNVDAILATMGTLDLVPHLSNIVCPTLVVSAGRDEIIPAERSRGLVDGIANARHIIVGDAGHALVVEQADRLADIVLSFLREVASNLQKRPVGPASPHLGPRSTGRKP